MIAFGMANRSVIGGICWSLIGRARYRAPASPRGSYATLVMEGKIVLPTEADLITTSQNIKRGKFVEQFVRRQRVIS